MTHKKLHFILTKLDEAVFEGEVDSVTLPGADGEFTVLPAHEAFITPLKKGTITIHVNEEKETHAIDGGMFEVSNNTATALL